jgi:uncharacterized repeat protein (TIGR03803 family)
VDMRKNKLSFGSSEILTVVAVILTLVSGSWGAAKEKVIHRFQYVKGDVPYAGLVFDGQGNLYGTTLQGGTHGRGTAFELSPEGGGWTETVLYNFNNAPDAANPYGGLVLDTAGNLYGTTYYGGTSNRGAVYKLTRGSNGKWTESILYSFADGDPGGALVFDAKGNLYGTTTGDGVTYHAGTVFELTPASGGNWNASVLYSFKGNEYGDGNSPYCTLTFDNAGDIYGTTLYGGAKDSGTVFKLTLSKGVWTESILYSFTGESDGASPYAGVTMDGSGKLYGTSLYSVFELKPTSGGGWRFSVLHDLRGTNGDGLSSYSGVVIDKKGNLYGTTRQGGVGCNYPGCGIAFKLAPQPDGSWKETILHDFESADDGSYSAAGLTLDQAGNLYGTTSFGGGEFGYGTVFEITP